MKTTTVQNMNRTRHHVRYPNAASRREILHKFLDNMLVTARVVAAVTAFLFLMTLA